MEELPYHKPIPHPLMAAKPQRFTVKALRKKNKQERQNKKKGRK